IKNIFQGQNAIGPTAAATTIRVEIRNGTQVPGLASRYQTELELINYEVIKTGNAPDQTLAKTIVYKITGLDRTDAENFLSKKFNTAIIHDQIPDWIKNEVSPEVDFFIILGQDSNLPVK
ncbi:MAG: LytR C-terminal domain-containing protein, partial [Parcubacteria group bacterium]